MNGRSERYRKRMLRRRVVAYTKFLMCVCAFTVVITGFASKASKPAESHKYYKEIKVASGDTLWDIAVENMTEEYRTVQEYIREVRKLNELYGDSIYYGQRLMIPYYSAEVK